MPVGAGVLQQAAGLERAEGPVLVDPQNVAVHAVAVALVVAGDIGLVIALILG